LTPARAAGELPERDHQRQRDPAGGTARARRKTGAAEGDRARLALLWLCSCDDARSSMLDLALGVIASSRISDPQLVLPTDQLAARLDTARSVAGHRDGHDLADAAGRRDSTTMRSARRTASSRYA